jgi:anti-anti-sigma regulatory factor
MRPRGRVGHTGRMALSFFINRKRTTCVVTFKGSLTPNDAESLDSCLAEALSQPAQYLILNMAGLASAEAGTSRAFTLFQQGIRSKVKLLICDLQPEAARVLKAEGLIRESEVHPDLMSALQAILSEEKG